jgi:hypothetical protein
MSYPGYPYSGPYGGAQMPYPYGGAQMSYPVPPAKPAVPVAAVAEQVHAATGCLNIIFACAPCFFLSRSFYTSPAAGEVWYDCAAHAAELHLG